MILAQGIHYMRSVDIMIIKYKSKGSAELCALAGRQTKYGDTYVSEITEIHHVNYRLLVRAGSRFETS